MFTTREPELEMIEVAIAAFNSTLAMDADPDMPESHFIIGGVLAPMLEETKSSSPKMEWTKATPSGFIR